MAAVTESTGSIGGPWAERCALAAAASAVPLVLFGGSVTTLGAGMAVQGWLIAEGHFLVLFPVDKWFRDVGTFVEHTHRLFGVLVGLFLLAGLVLSWTRGARARGWALVTLVAVVGQGALGGFRVLENSPELAFVHGAVAQAVFALLCLNACTQRRTSSAQVPLAGRALEAARALQPAAWLATGVLYAQVVIGAWYRHGLRPEPVAGHMGRFALHALGAVLVLGTLALLARRGTELQASGAAPSPMLSRALTWLPRLLVAQLVLGGLAWAGFRPGALGPAEWLLSIAHVLGGALLLTDTALIALEATRLARRGARAPDPAGQPAMGVR